MCLDKLYDCDLFFLLTYLAERDKIGEVTAYAKIACYLFRRYWQFQNVGIETEMKECTSW